MKVLFLDIDGVLNSSEYYERRAMLKNEQRIVLAPRDPVHQIDPDAVELLNEVITRTNCRIVVSSSWRFNPAFETRADLMKCLLRAGIRPITPSNDATLFDATPKITGASRSSEIKQWLSSHSFVERWAVIDDAAELDGLPQDRIVWTEHDKGIQQEQVEQLVKLLGEVLS